MVNNKMASLDTKLQNGDCVEIITKKNAKPNRKWLNYCQTSLAKRHIRGELGDKTEEPKP
jgi:guanosine-3',5'-bis(diphosphate) 3'-pyrophosphohydrolase